MTLPCFVLVRINGGIWRKSTGKKHNKKEMFCYSEGGQIGYYFGCIIDIFHVHLDVYNIENIIQ